MQIVIEIPKEEYLVIRQYQDIAPNKTHSLAMSIINGTRPKTGHWVSSYGNYICSECGHAEEARHIGKATHYCSFCGADMRADKDCSTCVNSDETDGSNCYECVKGIKDNYEADKERDND